MKELVKFESFLDLIREFNTEEKCFAYLAEIRWRGNVVCPFCKSNEKIYTYTNGKTYKCSCCKNKFNVLTNSVFQGTHIKIKDWFYAMYIMANHYTSISAKQLAKDLKITPKSALFLMNRIREAMKERGGKLFGEVEVDETFVGGKNKNRHADKKVRNAQGRSLKDKYGIYGVTERGGRVRTIHLRKMRGKGMRLLLEKVVDRSSTVFTDEYNNYNGLENVFKSHHRVNHGMGQYVDGENHTNTIESFWSGMKSTMVGTYRSVSKRRFFRYCYEFEFRWNTRYEDDGVNFVRLLSQTFGKRLTYAMSVAPDRGTLRL